MHKKIKSLFIIILALSFVLSGCAPAANNGAANNGADAPADSDAPVFVADNSSIVTGGSGNPVAAESANVSYRLSVTQWLDDAQFAKTCETLALYKDGIDEIIICCDHEDIPYMDDDMLAQYTTALTARISALKEMGFTSVGLYMHNTIGYTENNAGRIIPSRATTATDQTGRIAGNQLCPTSQTSLDYIAHKYTEYAKTGPDFILVGDDFSHADKSMPYTCYCNNCMNLFNSANGTNYMRVSLVTEMASAGDAVTEDVQNVRRMWSNFIVSTWCDVLTLVKDTVKGVNPNIKLGLTSTPHSDNPQALFNYTVLADALGADKVVTTSYFRESDFLRDSINAYVDSAMQATKFDSVADKQYNIDDYPQTDFKDHKIHMLEATSAIMTGVNGVVLSNVPLENADTMSALSTYSPMWDEMVKIGSTWELYGGTIGLDDEYAVYSAYNYYTASTGSSAVLDNPATIVRAGYLPYTPYQDNSSVTVLSGDSVLAYSDDEIKEIFSKGVIMDGAATKHLLDRGFDKLIGCSRASQSDAALVERFLDHELNGTASGTLNYMYGKNQYTFKLINGAEALSVTENVLFETSDKVYSYAFENELGGRVVVLGYLPWGYDAGCWQRNIQYRNFVEWTSNGTSAARVLNETKVAPLFKQPDDRSGFMLMLTNAFTDDTVDGIQVRIIGEYDGEFIIFNDLGERSVLSAENVVCADGYTTLTLPSISGWGFCVVYNV